MTKVSKVVNNFQSRVVLQDHDVPAAVNEGKTVRRRTICTKHVTC